MERIRAGGAAGVTAASGGQFFYLARGTEGSARRGAVFRLLRLAAQP
jgi:hypothetical protein